MGQTARSALPAPSNTRRFFSRFASRASYHLGTMWVFAIACGMVIAWAAVGPHFHFSDTWQLVMNTISSIVTFLMVFLIQNTQNRDSLAINLKLDEVIRAIHEARNDMIDIEKMTEVELEEVAKRYERIRSEIEQRTARRKPNPAA